MSTPRPPLGRDLVAAVALSAYSLAVAAGFARVFSGWAFLADMVLLVVVGHGGSFALRRARVRGWIAVPALMVALAWVLAIVHYGPTLRWRILPTAAAWDQFALDVDLVRDQFPTAVAPVLYGAGWATLAGVALAIAILMADAFAFRADARGESLVPGAVLFVFIAALGDSRLRITLTVALVAAGVLAVVALRALHDRARRVELAARPGDGSRLLPAAVATAVGVALVAGIVGPRIPGAGAEPLYDTKGRSGRVTEVLSPLVDIRSRLTNRSDVELFRVNADASGYWRVTTLPEFDGRTFRLPNRSLERVEGAFGGGSAASVEIRQRIQVIALGGQLVPAAADPVQASGESGGGSGGDDLELRLNRDTSTLVTSRDLATGDQLTIVSAAPRPSREALLAATAADPPDPIFLGLPDDLPGVVGELAAGVTAGRATPYEQALALQDWFRSEFEYSLEVQSGHGSNAIESFLAERVGYCEQFSATFAAMARTLGIPSRVAVGYTPGVVNDAGWYSVRGKNAHAWPELWFDGIGWVAFEPTPGRGAPGAEPYTGVPAQQDDSPPGGEVAPGDGEVVPTTPTTVVAPPTSAGDATSPTTTVATDSPGPLPDGGVAVPPDGDAPPATDGGASGDGGRPWLPITLLVVLAGAVAAPALTRSIRSRVARVHATPERIQQAWERAVDALVRSGVTGRESMTHHEWAAAAAARLPVAARPMRSLADTVDRVSFAPPGVVDLDVPDASGHTLGELCEQWSTQVDRIATDTLTPVQRARHYFTSWR